MMEITGQAIQMYAEVHEHVSPRALILNTARFGPHSKGDDTRSIEELEQMKEERDPLTISETRLPASEVRQITEEVETEVRLAFETALADPTGQFALRSPHE